MALEGITPLTGSKITSVAHMGGNDFLAGIPGYYPEHQDAEKNIFEVRCDKALCFQEQVAFGRERFFVLSYDEMMVVPKELRLPYTNQNTERLRREPISILLTDPKTKRHRPYKVRVHSRLQCGLSNEQADRNRARVKQFFIRRQKHQRDIFKCYTDTVSAFSEVQTPWESDYLPSNHQMVRQGMSLFSTKLWREGKQRTLRLIHDNKLRSPPYKPFQPNQNVEDDQIHQASFIYEDDNHLTPTVLCKAQDLVDSNSPGAGGDCVSHVPNEVEAQMDQCHTGGGGKGNCFSNTSSDSGGEEQGGDSNPPGQGGTGGQGGGSPGGSGGQQPPPGGNDPPRGQVTEGTEKKRKRKGKPAKKSAKAAEQTEAAQPTTSASTEKTESQIQASMDRLAAERREKRMQRRKGTRFESLGSVETTAEERADSIARKVLPPSLAGVLARSQIVLQQTSHQKVTETLTKTSAEISPPDSPKLVITDEIMEEEGEQEAGGKEETESQLDKGMIAASDESIPEVDTFDIPQESHQTGSAATENPGFVQEPLDPTPTLSPPKSTVPTRRMTKGKATTGQATKGQSKVQPASNPPFSIGENAYQITYKRFKLRISSYEADLDETMRAYRDQILVDFGTVPNDDESVEIDQLTMKQQLAYQRAKAILDLSHTDFLTTLRELSQNWKKSQEEEAMMGPPSPPNIDVLLQLLELLPQVYKDNPDASRWEELSYILSNCKEPTHVYTMEESAALDEARRLYDGEYQRLRDTGRSSDVLGSLRAQASLAAQDMTLQDDPTVTLPGKPADEHEMVPNVADLNPKVLSPGGGRRGRKRSQGASNPGKSKSKRAKPDVSRVLTPGSLAPTEKTQMKATDAELDKLESKKIRGKDGDAIDLLYGAMLRKHQLQAESLENVRQASVAQAAAIEQMRVVLEKISNQVNILAEKKILGEDNESLRLQLGMGPLGWTEIWPIRDVLSHPGKRLILKTFIHRNVTNEKHWYGCNLAAELFDPDERWRFWPRDPKTKDFHELIRYQLGVACYVLPRNFRALVKDCAESHMRVQKSRSEHPVYDPLILDPEGQAKSWYESWKNHRSGSKRRELLMALYLDLWKCHVDFDLNQFGELLFKDARESLYEIWFDPFPAQNNIQQIRRYCAKHLETVRIRYDGCQNTKKKIAETRRAEEAFDRNLTAEQLTEKFYPVLSQSPLGAAKWLEYQTTMKVAAHQISSGRSAEDILSEAERIRRDAPSSHSGIEGIAKAKLKTRMEKRVQGQSSGSSSSNEGRTAEGADSEEGDVEEEDSDVEDDPEETDPTGAE